MRLPPLRFSGKLPTLERAGTKKNNRPLSSARTPARTFKISHISPDIRVQCIHDHLAVSGAGDLDTSVDEARGGTGAFPCGIVADVLGLGEEGGQGTVVELGLAQLASLQEALPRGIERPVQQRQESQRLGGQDLLLVLRDGAEDADALEDGIDGGHGERSSQIHVSLRLRRGRVSFVGDRSAYRNGYQILLLSGSEVSL